MLKLLLLLVILAAAAASAQVTPNLGLNIPTHGAPNWDTLLNANFVTIDGLFPLSVALGGNGTATPALIPGTNITITGTWPSLTINSTGGASPAFSAITSGINATAAMQVGTGASLGPTGTGTVTANIGITTQFPYIDPRAKQFGSCIGDGTDTSAAATACWNAAEDYLQAHSGTIYCAAGTNWTLDRVHINSGDWIKGGGNTTKGCVINPAVDAAFVPSTAALAGGLNEVHMDGIYFNQGSNAIDFPQINGFYGTNLWFQNQTGCSLNLTNGERWYIGIDSVHSGANGFAPLCTGDPTKSLFSGGAITTYCTSGGGAANCGAARAIIYWLRELGSLNIGPTGKSAQWLWWGGGSGTFGGVVTESELHGATCFFSCLTGTMQLLQVYNSTLEGPDEDHVGLSGSPQAVGLNIGAFNHSLLLHYTPGYNTNYQTTEANIFSAQGSTIQDSSFSSSVNNSTTFGLYFGNAFQFVHMSLIGVTGGVYASNPTGSYKISVIGSLLSPSNLLGGETMSDQTGSNIVFNMMNDDNGATADTASFTIHRACGSFAYCNDFTSNGITLALAENLGFGNILLAKTAPTISSGFGTSPSITGSNGSATFRLNVGTGGSATSGVIAMNTTAATGWNCEVNDLTAAAGHVAYNTRQTASSTTTVTVENQTTSTGAAVAWAASDILTLNCMTY